MWTNTWILLHFYIKTTWQVNVIFLFIDSPHFASKQLEQTHDFAKFYNFNLKYNVCVQYSGV